MKSEIESLEKDRTSVEKDQEKVKDKINKTNEEMQVNVAQVEAKSAEIAKLQENYNQTHNATIKEQISKAAKEKQTLQKSQIRILKPCIVYLTERRAKRWRISSRVGSKSSPSFAAL